MIKEAILKGAQSFDDARKFDEEERAQYMNASEALTCIRKQWYNKHKAAADGPENWGFARRGLHGEVYMVDRIRRTNTPTLFMGDDQVQIIDHDLQLSCSPDGLVEAEDGKSWVGVEFKTIDPRTNRSNLPKPEHVAQLQIAMAMFEKHREEFPELGSLPLSGGVISYMDASNYDDITDYPVKLDMHALDKLATRAKRLLSSKTVGRLSREGKTNGGSECKQRCSFNKVCGVDGAAEVEVSSTTTSLQVVAYLGAKAEESAAKAKKDALAEDIKAALKSAGKNRDVVDGHTIALTTRVGSVSYAKVVKDHCPGVDLEPYRGSPSESLTVK